MYDIIKQKLFKDKLRVLGKKLKEAIAEDEWIQDLFKIFHDGKCVDIKDIKDGCFDNCFLELKG
jgi:hypothetical protein